MLALCRPPAGNPQTIHIFAPATDESTKSSENQRHGLRSVGTRTVNHAHGEGAWAPGLANVEHDLEAWRHAVPPDPVCLAMPIISS